MLRRELLSTFPASLLTTIMMPDGKSVDATMVKDKFLIFANASTVDFGALQQMFSEVDCRIIAITPRADRSVQEEIAIYKLVESQDPDEMQGDE